jgi:hypothetical protein
MSREDRLDFGDPAAVRTWLAHLRVALADANAVSEDLLRPWRERDLGHVQHRRLFEDARSTIENLLDYAGGSSEPNGSPARH